jgi:hypothetical protein
MSPLNPSGRLSKVEQEDKVFQIQTEFYHRPTPKITTTVILNGKTMNKVDTPWDQELITDEDLRKIEKALRQQHQRVTQMIEGPGEKAKPDRAEDSPVKKPWERLSAAEGIENVAVTNDQGEVLYMRTDSPEMEAILTLVNRCTRLVRFLSRCTRLGDFAGGQIKLRKEKIAWIHQKDQLWIACLNQKIDLDSFLKQTREIGMEKKIE